MNIRITLGWHLDGGAHPNPSAGEEASTGHLVTGPAGFLDFLVRRVGLGGLAMPEPVRIGAYLRRLSRARTPDCFYNRSFEADRWSTAKLLLNWRDSLYAGGWTGTVPETASDRLRTLAHVESIHEIPLGASPGESLQALLAAVQQVRLDDVERVTLTEPVVAWPALWRRLFDILAQRGVALADLPSQVPADGIDLAQLHRFLIDRTRGVFRNDGTVVLVEADHPVEAADVAAEWLAADPAGNLGLGVVRGAGSALLDSRLHGLALPQVGIGVRSPWRAAMQLLPLAFELCWDPLDPQRLLEFLSLPRAPIPRSAARRLTEALQEHPGIGGPLWTRALDEAVAIRARSLQQEGVESTELELQSQRYRERIESWIPSARYRPEPGLPLSIARAICARVAQWTVLVADRQQDELMQIAGGQAVTLDRVLQACGLPEIPRSVLNRMLDAVVGDGTSIPRFATEAATWSVVDRPGQIYGPIDRIMWIDFAADGPAERAPPWIAAERSSLAALGVEVEDARTRGRRERLAWVRAVLAARRSLLLVTPRVASGTEPTRHPLFDEICAAFGMTGHQPAFVTAAATFHHAAEFSLAGRRLRRAAVTARALPVPRLVWSFDPGLPRPTHDSPTGIELLLGCSFRWVLQSYARIQSGRSLALPRDDQMVGTFCHAIIERLFQEERAWDPGEAAARAAELFDELMPQMAAPLLLPGRELERQRTAERIRTAVKVLVSELAQAHLRVEGVEAPIAKLLADGGPTIRGKMDLVARHQNGRPIILDMKWSRGLRRRREQLKNGLPVQLAAYTWLLAQDGAAAPAAGFYMLRQARLLLTDDWPLPDQHVPGTDLAQLWRDVHAAYEAGLSGFAIGRVFATGVAEGAPEDQLPFALQPPCEYCAYQGLCLAPTGDA